MLKINYDALGIAASIACAIHCALLPIVLTSLPVLGINIINNSWFEIGMICLAAIIGFYSLWHGYNKHHHKKLPVVLFISGIALLIVKQIFHAKQLYFLFPAVLLIITAHLINYRECSKANRCNTTGCIH